MRRGHISAAELVQEFDISEEAIEALLQSFGGERIPGAGAGNAPTALQGGARTQAGPAGTH
jgi:hypothetical protein